MKTFYFTTLFLLGQILVYGQTNLQLKSKIDSLYKVDQDVQWIIGDAIKNKVPIDSLQKLEKNRTQTFNRHIPILKDLYLKFGYPTIQSVGKESSEHYFIFILHSDSDPKFQSDMLPILKKHLKSGSVSKKDYAYLYDRVKRNTGGKQLYGTQLSFDGNGNLFDSNNKIMLPKDLADPETVDKRRKKMGLQPIEKYYEETLEAFGRPRQQK